MCASRAGAPLLSYSSGDDELLVPLLVAGAVGSCLILRRRCRRKSARQVTAGAVAASHVAADSDFDAR